MTSHIQSVVFRRPIELAEAKAFLKRNNFKYDKVHVTPETLRFRQHDPSPTARYRTVPFKHGFFVVEYK